MSITSSPIKDQLSAKDSDSPTQTSKKTSLQNTCERLFVAAESTKPLPGDGRFKFKVSQQYPHALEYRRRHYVRPLPSSQRGASKSSTVPPAPKPIPIRCLAVSSASIPLAVSSAPVPLDARPIPPTYVIPPPSRVGSHVPSGGGYLLRSSEKAVAQAIQTCAPELEEIIIEALSNRDAYYYPLTKAIEKIQEEVTSQKDKGVIIAKPSTTLLKEMATQFEAFFMTTVSYNEENMKSIKQQTR